MNLNELFQVLSLNPKYRVQRHVQYLNKHIKIRAKHDKENFKRVYKNFEDTMQRLTIYHWLRNVTFALLYFSVILAVMQDITPITASLLAPIGEVANIIGLGVLSVLFILFSKMIGAARTDMMIEHAHLVAIAVKHNSKFTVHPEYKWGLFKEYE